MMDERQVGLEPFPRAGGVLKTPRAEHSTRPVAVQAF